MPIYCITGITLVPGDCWYVEAETALAAVAIVTRELDDLEQEYQPVDHWEVDEVPRPFTLPIWKD